MDYRNNENTFRSERRLKRKQLRNQRRRNKQRLSTVVEYAFIALFSVLVVLKIMMLFK